MIAFDGVNLALGGRAVLRDLSFTVEAGETLVLLGRSGSGKTTALKLINALLMPERGEVRVDGRSTREWDAIRLRRETGYVIQEVGLLPHWTVAENVGLVPRLEGWAAERMAERVDELLELVALDPAEYRGRLPRELSGGQRQRVGIARALAADPRVLLFDEPFGALDPVTRWELQSQFLELRKRLGKTAVFVTHDVSEALRLATRIGVLVNGGLESLASPAEFAQQKDGEAGLFLRARGGGVGQ